MGKTQRDATGVTDQPVYWFVVLEKARERSDFATAANAQSELRRLGVTVGYGKKQETANAGS